MKVQILLCLLVASFAAVKEPFTIKQDGVWHIAQFIEGFIFGAFGQPVSSISWCINDSVNLTETIIADFRSLTNTTRTEKAIIITEMLYHMVRDIPEIIQDCKSISNDTQEMIEIFHMIFRPH